MPVVTNFLTLTAISKMNLLLGFSELKFPHQKYQILFCFTNGQIDHSFGINLKGKQT